MTVYSYPCSPTPACTFRSLPPREDHNGNHDHDQSHKLADEYKEAFATLNGAMR